MLLRGASMKITASLFAVFVASAVAQDGDTRQLWNPEFAKKRPEAPAAVRPGPAPKYKPIAHSATPSARAGSGTMVGVTLWRMRDPKPADAGGTRLLVLEQGTKGREQT